MLGGSPAEVGILADDVGHVGGVLFFLELSATQFQVGGRRRATNSIVAVVKDASTLGCLTNAQEGRGDDDGVLEEDHDVL